MDTLYQYISYFWVWKKIYIAKNVKIPLILQKIKCRNSLKLHNIKLNTVLTGSDNFSIYTKKKCEMAFQRVFFFQVEETYALMANEMKVQSVKLTCLKLARLPTYKKNNL